MAFFDDSKINLSLDFCFCSRCLSEWDQTGLFDVMRLGPKIQVNVTFAMRKHAKLFIVQSFKQASVFFKGLWKLMLLIWG